MTPKDVWVRSTNFLEFGAGDGQIAGALISEGFDRVLVIVRHQRQCASIQSRHPGLAKHLVVSKSRRTIRNNNAEVLILSGSGVWGLWNRRNWRHVRQIAWAPRLALSSFIATILCLVQALLGQLRWVGLVHLATAGGRLVLLDVRRPTSSQRARHYVPHNLGIAGFLGRLRGMSVRHCVLRWFETLPDLPPGEDLDLLIPDEALETVLGVLAEGPGIQPIDVYTTTGLPGSDYADMPYFPPYLAEEVLIHSEPQGDLCLVPSPRHHFLSLAYHAVYHKGDRSGLTGTSVGAVGRPEHAYAEILRGLAERLGIQVEITLEGLDRYLGEHSWRPPADMLARLARRNRWLTQLVAREHRGSEDAGVGVFVVRREGLRDNGLAKITCMLEHQGFQIVSTRILGERESRSAARCIRGGNWGRGPWKTSGGPPAAAIVTYDPEPLKPTAWQRKEFPRLTNARLLVKKQIRDALNRELPTASAATCYTPATTGTRRLSIFAS